MQIFKKTPILKALGELPPERRLNVMQPIFAVIALATVIPFMWKIISDDRRDKDRSYELQLKEVKADCKERDINNQAVRINMQYQIDSLKVAIFSISKEMYENRLETINQQRELIKKQKEILKR